MTFAANLLNYKKQFIVLSAIAIGVLHLVPLYTDNRIYPFEKYDMFSKVRRRPIFRSVYLYVLDSDKVERPAPRSLFLPYNRRGLHAVISKLIPTVGATALLDELLELARKRDPRVFGLRLYNAECSCEEFAADDLSSEEFVSQKCKKIIVADAYVQKG